MSLVSDQAAANLTRDAANLYQTVEDLKSQFISNNQTINAFKANVKAAAAVDTFNAAELLTLGKALNLKVAIIAKAVSYKTQLEYFRDNINNVDYAAELQTQIDQIDSVS